MDWPTPTPIPALPTPEFLGSFDAGAFGQSLAQNIVGGFNFFDSQPLAGLIWFVIFAAILLMGLMSLKTHIESL